MTNQIELPANSLYINGEIVSFDDGEVLVREPIKWESTNEDKAHTVVEGDRLDGLAWKYYSKQVEDASKYWWVIADANAIDDPTDLSVLIGEKITIPDINKFILKI